MQYLAWKLIKAQLVLKYKGPVEKIKAQSSPGVDPLTAWSLPHIMPKPNKHFLFFQGICRRSNESADC